MTAPNYLFLPYQRRWVEDEAQFKVIEKSRRVGLSWAEACDDVLAAAEGLDDIFYVGPTEGHALEFIQDCEWWCRQLKLVQAVEAVDREIFLNEDGEEIDTSATDEKSIQAQRIRFHSGRSILALSGNPRNLRGKGRGGGGRIVLDEFAHHSDQEELLKAATALLMWGASIRVVSTHNGEDNLFNTIIKEIRDQNERAEKGLCKPHEYSLHRVTLDDALDDGFFQRVVQTEAQRSLQRWTKRVEAVGWAEAQAEYRQWLIDSYPFGWAEELMCEPSKAGSGDYFDPDWFPVVDSLQDLPGNVKAIRTIRVWDFAATKPSKANREPDWTRGGLWMQLSNGQYALAGMESLRDGPAQVNALLKRTAELDGRRVEIAQPQDAAAAGKSDALSKEKALTGFSVTTVRISKDKKAYARVWAPIAKRGDIILIRGHDGGWIKPFLAEAASFPGGRFDDQVDTGNLFFEVVFGSAFWDGKDSYTGGKDHRHPTPAYDDDEDWGGGGSRGKFGAF